MNIQFLLFILFFHVTVINSNISPCNTINKKVAVSFQKAKECIFSNKFDIKIKHDTVTTLKSLYKNYVFQDISLNSLGSYKIKENINEKINEMEIEKYENDYLFHADLQEIIKSLKDAHTKYIIPKCYYWRFLLPFGGISKIVNDEQKIFIKNWKLKSKTRRYPRFKNFTNYDNWEILEIDGVKGLDKLIEFANEKDGRSRDLSVRFNNVLKSFFDRNLLTYKIPDNEFVTFKIKSENGEEEKIISTPFSAFSLIDFTENDFLETCGYNSETIIIDEDEDEDVKRRRIVSDDLFNNEFEYLQSVNSPILYEEEMINKQNEEIGFLYGDVSGVTIKGFMKIFEEDRPLFGISGFINIGNPEIGMLRVGSFFPRIRMEEHKNMYKIIHEFGESIFKILDIFKKSSIEKIIVDMRGNGGGIGCLTHYLVEILSPYSPQTHEGVGDLFLSEFMEKYHCKEVISPVSFSYQDQKRKGIDEYFFSNGVKRMRGEKIGIYSKLYDHRCGLFNYILYDKNKFHPRKSPLQFEPENIVVLSDGLCASACGMFVTAMKKLKLGKVVVQGGILNEDIAMSTVKGSAVFSRANDRILEVCNVEFPEFPSTAKFFFSFFETYPYDELSIHELDRIDHDYPSEFMKLKSDKQLYYWNFDKDDSGIYDFVIPVFDECYDWQIKRNDECIQKIEKGVYGNQCKNSKFSKECVLRGCESGFYLNSLGNECIIMPVQSTELNKYINLMRLQLFARANWWILIPFCSIDIFILIFCCYCCWKIRIRLKKRKNKQNNNDDDTITDERQNIVSTTDSTNPNPVPIVPIDIISSYTNPPEWMKDEFDDNKHEQNIDYWKNKYGIEN